MDQDKISAVIAWLEEKEKSPRHTSAVIHERDGYDEFMDRVNNGTVIGGHAMLTPILECDVPEPKYKNVHWYRWGDEPSGCVSVGRYSPDGTWIPMGIRPKEYAIEALGATHHCPHN